MPNQTTLFFARTLVFIAGIALAIIASYDYLTFGYSLRMLCYFTASILISGAYFYQHRTQTRTSWLCRNDLLIIMSLALVFAPLYLMSLERIPWQVNEDEVTILIVDKGLIQQATVNPFGLNRNYFGIPNVRFIPYVLMSKFFGDISLTTLRTADAVFGLIAIILSYLLFRLMMPAIGSVGGAMLLGASHSFLGLSRMVMSVNIAVVIELLALICFMLAAQRRCPWYAFLGGLTAGFGFYVYFPARIIIVLWAVYLVLAWYFLNKMQTAKSPHLLLSSIAGFLLIATPVLWETAQNPDIAFSHLRGELLVFPDAQTVQQKWYFLNTTTEGITRTILNGLTAFNSNKVDHAWIYVNEGHGFVDPLTSVLLWLGLLLGLYRNRHQSQRTHADLLAIIGFLVTWLTLVFFTGKNPNYPRLLITLPFVIYLTTIGLETIADRLSSTWQKSRRTSHLLFMALVISIALWNVTIYTDFVKRGSQEGHTLGGTIRFIEERSNVPDYTFYIVNPYYNWGENWHKIFVGPHQQSMLISPIQAQELTAKPPLALFMSKDSWSSTETYLRSRYPQLVLHNIKSDGSRIVVEIAS